MKFNNDKGDEMRDKWLTICAALVGIMILVTGEAFSATLYVDDNGRTVPQALQGAATSDLTSTVNSNSTLQHIWLDGVDSAVGAAGSETFTIDTALAFTGATIVNRIVFTNLQATAQSFYVCDTNAIVTGTPAAGITKFILSCSASSTGMLDLRFTPESFTYGVVYKPTLGVANTWAITTSKR